VHKLNCCRIWNEIACKFAINNKQFQNKHLRERERRSKRGKKKVFHFLTIFEERGNYYSVIHPTNSSVASNVAVPRRNENLFSICIKFCAPGKLVRNSTSNYVIFALSSQLRIANSLLERWRRKILSYLSCISKETRVIVTGGDDVCCMHAIFLKMYSRRVQNRETFDKHVRRVILIK
jgi:hypothetical protein